MFDAVLDFFRNFPSSRTLLTNVMAEDHKQNQYYGKLERIETIHFEKTYKLI